MNRQTLRCYLREITIALHLSNGTTAQDPVGDEPTEENTWANDHTREIAMAERLQRELLSSGIFLELECTEIIFINKPPF